jgi:pyruvate ferredoxin oxidoreductase alpha subunit
MKKAMDRSVGVIEKVFEEFYKETGVKMDFFEAYKTEDAEIVFVVMNSTAGTVRYVVDKLREKGKKVGVIKVRVYRPFVVEKFLELIPSAKFIAVMDRSLSIGTTGSPLYQDITSGLFANKRNVLVNDYIYGLGGRDFTDDDAYEMYEHAEYSLKEGISGQIVYVGLNPNLLGR